MEKGSERKEIKDDYHLLVDSLKDYAVYMLDTQGNIITWNKGAERIKGFSEKEIIGQHFSILFLEEDRKAGKPQMELKTALETGKFEEEGWRRKKDGSHFWANVILRPIYSDSNEHIGFSKITQDLNERRRNKELHRLLVNQVVEYGIFMMNEVGVIETWNQGAQRIKGYTEEEIVGKNFSLFYTPEDRANNKPRKALKIAIKEGEYKEEGWRVRKDGSWFWANIVITPIYTDRHVGFAKITRDLTERKETEKIHHANAILQSANRELERFSSIVSHDLKEPLRKISIYASQLSEAEAPLDGGMQRKMVEKIASAAKKMSRMIEEILAFSTVSHQHQFEKCNLTAIVKETLELLEHSIKEKSAKLSWDNLPETIIIPGQIKQLFQNLISNSLKFSKEGVQPVISISHSFIRKQSVMTDGVLQTDQFLEIRVRDNGIGFDQIEADHIFDLHKRLQHAHKYEGTGLGLAICKKIVENHAGTITVQSQKGEGTEFIITIPA